MATKRDNNVGHKPLQTEQLSVPGLPDDFWSNTGSAGTGVGAGRSASPPSK